MRLTLKSSISLLLCQAVYSYGEPCWQAQTEEAPDGRICVLFDSVTTPGRTTVYNGRSAPDLATIDQTKVGHFCAYEVDRGVERAEEYYWLKGSETDIRTKLKSYKEHTNKPESADQSKSGYSIQKHSLKYLISVRWMVNHQRCLLMRTFTPVKPSFV